MSSISIIEIFLLTGIHMQYLNIDIVSVCSYFDLVMVENKDYHYIQPLKL